MRRRRAVTGRTAHAARRRRRPRPAAALNRRRQPDASAAAQLAVDRDRCPRVGQIAALDFPTTERARLSNGIELVYARRTAVPVTRVAVSSSTPASPPIRPTGSAPQALMLTLLDEGTAPLNSIQIAEAQERLGAQIGTGASARPDHRHAVRADAPTSAPSLDLLADIVRNPAFAPGEVERLRGQQLAAIASEMTQPQGIAAAHPAAAALRHRPSLWHARSPARGDPAGGRRR